MTADAESTRCGCHRGGCAAGLVLLTVCAMALGTNVFRDIAVADAVPSAVGASGCPAVTGVFLPGTWETNAGADDTKAVGSLAPVATALAERFGADFEFRFPAYAAKAFDGMAYGASKETGVDAARRVISEVAGRCPATKFVLAGYSQGADSMGDVAAKVGCSGDPVAADRVLAVGLIADPHQGTAGGKLVGPAVDGQGIAGPRESGFCALSAVTAEICATKDKYCATNATENPITAGIGQALTKASGDATTGQGDLADSLTSGLSASKIADLPNALTRLGKSATAGQSEAAAGDATEVANTLRSLGDLNTWVAENPSARTHLANAPDGSGQKAANGILDGLNRSDIGSALDSLANIGVSATQSHAGAEQSSAKQATDSVVPLTDAISASGSDVAAQAAQVLAVLKPSIVLDQTLNVVRNGLSFAVNVPSLVDSLNRMIGLLGDPTIDVAGKVRGLHEVVGEVNTLFEPLVKLADGVDLHTASKLIALIPDTTGTAQIASVLVDVLANLNVVKLAKQVGQLQNNVWGLAETLSTGGDLLSIGARLFEFVPTALGFATVAVETLSGKSKSSTEGSSPSNTDVTALGRSLVSSTGSNSTDAVTQLLSEGADAVSFLLSGVHQDYGNYVVDSDGRTAVQWLTDWFSNRIRHVVGVA